jgi:para-nitrobenzyl esterase
MLTRARVASFAALAIVVTLQVWSQNAGAQSPSCVAVTQSGVVQGVDQGATCAFLGIPYAAPPTANLRWKAPQAPTPWATTLNVITPPTNCTTVQAGALSGVEDCLKINIWVRDPYPASPAPVIVWLHTGAFFAASNNFPGHVGRRLAEETGAIIVNANYRLGIFGFLAHDALAAEDPSRTVSGNYGLLDQRAALQWVHDNIAQFGGDPDNVTIAGTSAGGESVGLHLVSPGSAPLFHRAALQSGAATLKWPTHAEGAAQGNILAAAVGCTDPATAAACLRGKPADQLLLALGSGTQQVLERANQYFWLPVVDGLEIPDQPRTLFETGQFRKVPTIVGFTRDEGWGNFINRSFAGGASLAQYESWISSEFGALGPAVLGMYPASSFPSPAEAMARVLGDGHFVCEGQRLASLISEAHQPVYVYSYEHVIDTLSVGHVNHGFEGNILFGNNYQPAQFPAYTLNATDQALHAAMAGYWTRFAATGSPNIEDETVVHWPLFKEPLGEGRGANRYLVLKPVIEPGKRLREAECGFWSSHFLRSFIAGVSAGTQ